MYPARYGRRPLEHYRTPLSSRNDPHLPDLSAPRLRLTPPPPLQRSQRGFSPTSVPNTPRTLEEATSDVIKNLDANKEELAQRISKVRNTDLTIEGVFKMVPYVFRFFDQHVFLRKLNHRVEFHGHGSLDGRSVIDYDDSGKTYAKTSGQKSVDVVLNTEVFEYLMQEREPLVAQDLIIATIAHQLIHAYFIVACGYQNDDKKANQLLSHGEHFGTILLKIKDITGKTGNNPLPLSFGNPIPELALRGKYCSPHPLQNRLRSSVFREERKGSTECPRDVKALREEDVRDWYKNKCLKTIDPDVYVYSAGSRTFEAKSLSKCGDKSTWVEISHKSQPFKVPRKIIDAYSSLRKRFEDGNRKFAISSDVRKDVVEELITFLCEDRDEWAPGSLKMAIGLYKLALSLKFDELKEHMLDAMYLSEHLHHHHAPETVVEILRAVYDAPTQPDSPLREWAVSFLKQTTRIASRDPRLSRLRSVSMALKTDISRAEHEMGGSALNPTTVDGGGGGIFCPAAQPTTTNYLYATAAAAAAAAAAPHILAPPPQGISAYTTYAPIPVPYTTSPLHNTSARFVPVPPAPAALAFEPALRTAFVDEAFRVAGGGGFVYEDEYGPARGHGFRRYG